VVLLIVWYFTAGVTFNFDLKAVYAYRDNNSELANYGLLGYLVPWIYKGFSVILIAYSLVNRRFLLLALALIAQVIFFGASAHKAVLFYPIMLIGLWFLMRRKVTNALYLPYLFAFLTITCLSVYLISDNLLLPSLFVRRVFFVPAKLTYEYLEFFGTIGNGYVYWSNSVLSGILSYPYTLSVPETIGLFNGSDSHANNNFISFGYAHAGIAGVVMYSFIIGFIFKIIDILSWDSMPLLFTILIFLIPIRTLFTSSDLLTTLISHGLFLIILILYFLRRKSYR
jgi:hypothetical protein